MYWHYGFPWLNQSSFLTSLLGGIKCLYRSDLYKFLLVSQYLCVHVRMSLISLSLLFQQFPAYIIWMVCMMWCKWPHSCCFVGCCFQDLFKTAHCILFWFHVAFSVGISLKSKWCNHTVVLTQLQLGRIPVLFYQRDHVFIWGVECYFY